MTDHRLDDSQRAVAEIEGAVRQIVLSPPGSGKTETVAALVEHLVAEGGLSAADDLLVLSFSRAAVNALRRRVHGRTGIQGLGVRTLDALASQLLGELVEGEWKHLSFDRRIAEATARIENGEARDFVSQLDHVIVDEVQDLVGVRADLVLALLSAIRPDAGFSVLGDPRQAIYDFQLTGDGGTTSDRFLTSAVELGSVRTVSLSGSYRARSPEAHMAIGIGHEVATREPRTRSFLSGLLAAGGVETVARAAARWSGTTAFLCRTNGVALLAAQALREHGLDATVRAPSDELPIAAWIGRAFADVTATSVRFSDVEDDLENADLPIGLAARNAWRLLKSVEKDFRSSERLDLKRLSLGLSRGAYPIELLGEDSDVVVSTIHRAKGLEFDNVVLVNAHDLVPASATADDLAVAYVAITRPRDRIVTAKCEMPAGVHLDRATQRWVRAGFRKGLTFGFEIRGVDTRHAGGDMLTAAPTVGAAAIARVNPRLSSLDRPVYDVATDGTVVARTNENFGQLVSRRLGGMRTNGRPWPDMRGLAIDSVETVVTNPVGAASGPWFSTGVRVNGLADLVWDGIEKD